MHGDTCPYKGLGDYGLFAIQCLECGGVCCYADDSTCTVVANSAVELSQKLTSRYEVLAEFLAENKLKVNDDKTHLLVRSTRQMRRFRDTSAVIINKPTAVISPSPVERLLGAQVHQDLH